MRITDDLGGRGGSPSDFGASASAKQRGGVGMEQSNTGVSSSNIPGAPHSSSGFRHALEKSARSSSRLKDQLPGKEDFGGMGFRKPNYFAQGGGRHGMHIGAG